jgi:hypothetical protein
MEKFGFSEVPDKLSNESEIKDIRMVFEILEILKQILKK